MGQRAGKTEQKFWPSVEAHRIHHSSDGRPTSRIGRLGQSQRQTGCYFSLCLMDQCLIPVFVWQSRFSSRLFFSCLSAVLPTAALPVWHPVPERSGWLVGPDPGAGLVIRPSAKIQTSRDGPLLCFDQGQRSKHIPTQAQDLLVHSDNKWLLRTTNISGQKLCVACVPRALI